MTSLVTIFIYGKFFETDLVFDETFPAEYRQILIRETALGIATLEILLATPLLVSRDEDLTRALIEGAYRGLKALGVIDVAGIVNEAIRKLNEDPEDLQKRLAVFVC